MKASRGFRRGFTLVEVMVALTVSTILVGCLLAAMSPLTSTIHRVDSKIDAFQNAESGFDLMTQKLSDATLNTYYDYDNPSAPTTYLRRSDLQFLIAQNSNLVTAFPTANPNSGQSIFFVLPAGYSNNGTYANTSGLLNACGYYVQFGPNSAYWPNIFNGGNSTVHYRYRLMQAIQSTEFNNIYGDVEPAAVAENNPTWIAPLSHVALPIAENVIALIIWPQSPALASPVSNDYQYNSRQGFPTPVNTLQAEQLPQLLQISLVVIDAASATRLDTGSPAPPAIIENALKGGSNGTGLFKASSTDQYSADLALLENALAKAHINYQVLTTSVTLRESKWSNGQ